MSKMMSKKNLVATGRWLALLSVALLSIGCASNSDLDSIRTMAEKAQTDASEARRIAEESMRMSRATDERINRMFQRSMQK